MEKTKKRHENEIWLDIYTIALTAVWGGRILGNQIFRAYVDYDFDLFGHHFKEWQAVLLIAAIVVLRLVAYFVFVQRREIWNFATLSISCFAMLGVVELIERKHYLLLAVIGFVAAGYIILNLATSYFKTRNRRITLKKIEWRKAVSKSYVFTVILLNLTGLLAAGAVYKCRSAELVSKEHKEKQDGVEVSRQEKLIDIARDFRESNFNELDEQGKVDLAQRYANYLADELGVARNPVLAKEMIRETIGAYYDSGTGYIYINKNALNDRENIMEYIPHEVFHGYQQYWVDLYEHMEARDSRVKYDKLYEFRRARVWADEFANYHSYSGHGTEDYMEYYTQDVEQSANDFAQEAVYKLSECIQYFEAYNTPLSELGI